MSPWLRPTMAMIFALLTACASITDPTRDWTPERFYQEAKEKLEEGDYASALKYFEGLEARYPYGRYAEQAQLETAYVHYKDEEPELAIAAADRFIRQHPTHPSVDYAYYLKGLINFHGESNIINWLLGAKDDPAERDPKRARESYEAFRELVERFPKSRYAEDSRARMVYLYDAQARYEINVARFYYERSAYVAAVNRSKHVLENYARTPVTEDALGIQALSYRKMGLTKLAEDTVRVLKKNFPNSRYLPEIAALKASG